jgi:hypothetical protein
MWTRSGREEDTDVRTLLTNKGLSWKAKGVAVYIIGNPGASGKDLAANGRDGNDAV